MKSLVILLILLCSAPTWSQTGIGFMLGNPSGITAKRWLGGDHAVDFGAGFAFGSKTNFSVHSDYLLHSKGAFFYNDVHPLDLYYGLGGRFKFADDINVGLRIPVGLAHTFGDQKADVFFEGAPVIDFISRTGIDLNVLVGARLYL